MGRMLALTSPLMHGEDVHRMNHLLAGHNVFKTDYHPGADDGQYGPQHASAVKRAKYAIGYPDKDISTVAGDLLRAYLEGSRKLTPAMVVRRRVRNRPRPKPLRVKALERMHSRNGLAESPQGSNRNWLVAWWYSNKAASAPWCCIDVSEAYLHAGAKAFSRGSHYAYVPYLEQDAARGTSGLARIPLDSLQPGDIVTFAWAAKGVGHGEHVGLFVRWVEKGSVMETEEGNTDAAGGAEGGQQLSKTRNVSEANVCIRVR